MEKCDTVICVYVIEVSSTALSTVNIRLKDKLQNMGNGFV